MGHLVSTVELAKLVLQRDHRISILILIVKLPFKSSSMLDTFLDNQSRDNPYPARLTFSTLPPLSNPPDSSSPLFFPTVIDLNKPLIKEAVESRVRAGSSFGFVLDMFCTGVVDVAAELKVPSYIYFTSGVSLLNLLFYFGSLVDGKGVDICDKFSDPNIEFDVPGFKGRVKGSAIPAVCLDKENGSSMILNHTRRFKKSKGILVNSFEELETYGVQTLLEQAAEGSMPRVYPVGPILDLNKKSRDGSPRQDDEESTITQWLDNQPLSSVVFLCFGSMGTFDEAQVKEMAHGIEKSGHRFLWSLRKPPPEGKMWSINEHETFVEALPEGFLERTADRGKIIGWAPQVSILGHPSIGGFVSHCGWNSTLESLWFGVPIATWPLYAEQQLNAFELLKELELAVEIRMDYRRDWNTKTQNFMVTAEEIENGVKKLMSLDDETKNRVEEMKDKSRNALEEGGSSYKWLGCFIQDVLSNAA
ncbi:UDP-glycosyltransferase 71A15 [Bienertia sinuspersici]